MHRTLSSPTCCMAIVVAAALAGNSSADEPKAIRSATTQSTQELQQASLTAEQILDRMGKTYAECKSYHDSGVVKTVFIAAGGGWTDEKPFTTVFVRPDGFRFEYRYRIAPFDTREGRYIVWRSGKQVQTWWDTSPGIKTPDSLKIAIAGATGVSSGSAITIPSLLLPNEIRCTRLTDLKKAKRVEDADIKGVGCFCIRGELVDSPNTFWIDRETFLMRRIDSQHKFDNFRTEVTTTYEPVMNGNIPDKMLEFNPPKQK